MRLLKDSKGREWSLTLTLGDVRRLKLKGILDLDHLDPEKLQATFEQLMSSPLYVLDVLYAWLEPEISAAGLKSVEEFTERWEAHDLLKAATEVCHLIFDFFRPRMPAAIYLDKAIDVVGQEVEKARVMLEAMTTDQVRQYLISGDWSGALPAGPDSLPGVTASESSG